ncbi:serine hydrolase [Streptomyces spiroverticillatus]|uniref:Serine hydrolase n=1 Tax=Streptomyces finlayi TaxID=67296 RepID=A0A919CFC1_9ACTN|nr:serine hydrolase [Streptomyces finlayi]GHA44918.1 serine hydrolase [Streptomyces spiroverticillatus]GHD18098.1 serine hydrolase [Streptomyces finlayi]
MTPRPRPRIDDLYGLALPEQPAVSPDGKKIVYVLRTADREADRDLRTLWQVGATGSTEPRQLTRGQADMAPAWSPDGTLIAFLRAPQGGPAQVWLLPATGGEPEQVTTLPLGAGAPAWSPDGSTLAFTAPVDLAAAEGEIRTARTRRAQGPVVARRLDYKADGLGLLRTLRTHLHVVRLADRQVRQLTHGDWHAGSPAWSPDGTRLAFPAARDADADLTLRSAAYVIEVSPHHAEPVPVGAAGGQAATVTWTADGTALLVVGSTGTAVGHARLLRVPVGDTGADTPVDEAAAPVDLTGVLDRNVMPGGAGYPGALPRLTADGRQVLVCLRDHGLTRLYVAEADGSGVPRRADSGDALQVGGVSAAGGTVAVVLSTATSYGEIATVDLGSGAVAVRTSHGTPGAAGLLVREEREFTISDGTVVHGWLVRDPKRRGPAPLLLDIHGGPHNAWNGAADSVHLYHQELAARGWTVLLLNPRGSDGYGEKFFTAALGAWGISDAADFTEPLDQLVAEGIADPKRLAVTGYSYGGYMTCYLTSRDDRFAAAVAGGVVSDLTSIAGTSDAAHPLSAAELGGAPWAAREKYAEQSPMTSVDHVRTPTLVVQGGDDQRCPVGQAEQWFTALRARGVPTELVLYPGSSHLFLLDGPPSHRADFNQRIVDWVERYAGEPGRPHKVPFDTSHWQRRLTELATAHRVPGAALGVLRLGPHGVGDDVLLAHHGVLNTATGVDVTDDSVFQIGSVTKVWTATVVMQLVDEGKLDLDAPVVDVLPELRLADRAVTQQVTMRHLLTHTSGIDGDVFTDTGRGDDCLERYVGLLGDTRQNHPVGATFSYCNSGYNLAGRVIEKLTGLTWDQALRERLFTPLGLTRALTLPEEALLLRAAVGHVADGDAAPVPARVWGLPRSVGPAGLVSADTADVLAFARLHLTGGLGPDGARVLSEESAAQMAAHQTALPDQDTLGDSWGLGWIRFGWDGQRLYGHDGNTIGQSAFLRVLPDQGLAVTLLTNGGNTRDLYHDLFREIFAELAGITMPRPLAPADQPPTVDGAAHTGVYERAGARIEVLTRDGGLTLRQTTTGPLAELEPTPTQEFALVPVEDGRFVFRQAGTQTWVPVTFYTLPTGEPYVHYGARATPKVS